MEKIKLFTYFLIFLLIIPVQITHGEGLPKMDGIISDGEWDGSHDKTVRMTNGIDISVKAIYTDTDVYYLITFPHNSPGDIIQRNPTDGINIINHDYFGLEFDNNNDGAIMGTSDNPDDLILIDYDMPGAIDMFSHSFHVYRDVNFDGENNADGASNDENGMLIYEFRKSLNPQDINGYDVSLKEGDSYYVMFAIWDDKKIRTDASYINIKIGASQFVEMIVGDTALRMTKELIAVMSLFVAGIVLIVPIARG